MPLDAVVDPNDNDEMVYLAPRISETMVVWREADYLATDLEIITQDLLSRQYHHPHPRDCIHHLAALVGKCHRTSRENRCGLQLSDMPSIYSKWSCDRRQLTLGLI